MATSHASEPAASSPDGSPGGSPGGSRADLGDLPYAPWLLRTLGPLRRAFHGVNRWVAAPMIRSGLGPLLSTPATGSILVLRTRGRRSGLVREAPLGYAIVAGRVVVVAGYGRSAHWFQNALADPEVEVALPGAVLAGRAEEVLDPGERRDAFRALIGTMGVIGRVTLGDVTRADDERVDELAAAFPLLAITPTEVRPGPYDPGGTFWRIPLTLSVMAAGAAIGAGLAVRQAGKRAPDAGGAGRCRPMAQARGERGIRRCCGR